MPIFGLHRRIPAAARFQVKGQGRHTVAVAARPRLETLLFHHLGFEGFELAPFHLRQRAHAPIHIGALRLVTPLQLQALVRLRLIRQHVAEFLQRPDKRSRAVAVAPGVRDLFDPFLCSPP